MITKKEIQVRLFELVKLITNDFVNREGLVSSTYPPSKSNLISDFDDIFPFLLFLDVDSSFLKSQILHSRRYTCNGLVLNNGQIVSYRNDEYLGALFAYYRKYNEGEVYKLIGESLRGIKELLIRNKVLCTFHDIFSRRTYLISSPRVGALIEVLIENRKLIPDNIMPEFDEIIKKSLELWIKCSFFQKYSLFPSKLFLKNEFKNGIFSTLNIPLPYRIKQQTGSNFYYSEGWQRPIATLLYKMPIGEKVQCMKENTNFVFSLIEAYKVYRNKTYRNAIEKWIRGIKENMYNDGFIYKFWAPPNKIKIIGLSQNFSVIDVLCDTYKFVSNNTDHLKFAENIAESWISELWDIGLVPRTPKGTYNHIDEQTDFCISLMRLYELTKKEKYREVAKRIFEGILKFHKREYGYILSVDNKGNLVDGTISPKYNSLFLKVLIFFNEERKIYESECYHNLLNDR